LQGGRIVVVNKYLLGAHKSTFWDDETLGTELRVEGELKSFREWNGLEVFAE